MYQFEILRKWGAPWQWDATTGYLRNEAGDVLATFPHGQTVSDTSDHARGRLAALAPELLAELSVLVQRCEGLPATFPAQAGLLATIAREARGLLASIEDK